jgi:carbamoyl-phosphate synthase large subunit
LSNEKIRILVTAIGGGGHGDQILKALRIANDTRFEIFGADSNQHCPQAGLVEQFTVMPKATDPSYLDKFLAYCREMRIQALFHGCEPELKVFAANRQRIEAQGIFLPINPTGLIELCMDKSATNARLEELGFKPPRFVHVSERAALGAIDWFPVVVKPAVGGGGSANVMIAQDAAELRALGDYFDLGGRAKNFMVQEYVGTPDHEYTVGVLSSMDGEYINAIAVRRHLSGGLNVRAVVPNRTSNKALGQALVVSSGVSHGDIGRFESVTSQCRKIAAGLGARGPLNIQCRLVDQVVKVFEINPRFSGTTSLRAMVGFNEPDVLLKQRFFGEKLQVDFPYREATILRSLVETVVETEGGAR